MGKPRRFRRCVAAAAIDAAAAVVFVVAASVAAVGSHGKRGDSGELGAWANAEPNHRQRPKWFDPIAPTSAAELATKQHSSTFAPVE